MRNRTRNIVAVSLGAAGAGAALMFLLDPNRGGLRRRFVGGKAVHLGKFIGRGFRRQRRDLENRPQGVMAATSAKLTGDAAPDDVLAERVRAKMGHVLSHPRAIDVTAERGVVELRGAVLRSERRRAIRAAESVRGVRVVQHDALRTYSDERGLPGFHPFQPSSRVRESKQGNTSKRMRGLRLAIALASGAVAGYKAFKASSQARQRASRQGTSSERAA